MGSGTSSTNHLAGLDPPKHAAEALVATQGNAHPIPHRALLCALVLRVPTRVEGPRTACTDGRSDPDLTGTDRSCVWAACVCLGGFPTPSEVPTPSVGLRDESPTNAAKHGWG